MLSPSFWILEINLSSRKQITLRKLRRRETITEILFLLPQYILYLGLTIIPFLIALPIVLTDKLDFLDKSTRFIGFANFLSVLKEPLKTAFSDAFLRTALFTLLNYAMVFLYGLTLALIIFEYTSRLKQGFFAVIFLPYMISGMGIGMLLIMLFAKDTGSYNLLLLELGLLKQPLDIKSSDITIVAMPLFIGWRSAGFNMAVFLSGLLTIPIDTIDAAKVDGVSYRQRVLYVYIPQIVPNITLVTIFCLLGSFGVFDVPVGLGALKGNTNARFLSVLIYQVGFSAAGEKMGTLAQAITISMVVYLPLLFIAFLLNSLQKKLQY